VKQRLGANTLVVAAAAFLTLAANGAYFRNLATIGGHGLGESIVLGALLFLTLVMLFGVGAFRWMLKPWFTFLFLVAAGSAAFMDAFNVVIDRQMLANAMLTDTREVTDLLTWRVGAYTLLIGVLPSVVLWRGVRVAWRSPGRELLLRTGLLGAGLAALVATALSAAPLVSSFVREQKPLRYYANPVAPLYAAWGYARSDAAPAPDGPLEAIANHTEISHEDIDRELIIMVVGETVRADHFSLNGYERDTNPELSTLGVISFADVDACGTSTAVSLPCMFSVREGDAFDAREERSRENVLDLLGQAGVNLLWRDNNSSSKGVAERIDSEDYRTPEHNVTCDAECRDAGMLEGLQAYVDGQAKGDILIILHQMGSHGPAYFKRYPPEFRRFTPTCDTSQLDDCTLDAIVNSYDNSILYTDWFLAQAIDLLRRNDDRFETALMYVGDHGESLGEHGLFLHGAPMWLAPESQTRVPMIFWFGRHYDDVDPAAFARLTDRRFSHDNVFHTLLGLFEIESDAYRADLDLLQLSRMGETAADGTLTALAE